MVGSVKSAELKQRVERVLRSVKGVIEVDNQLVVVESTPQTSQGLHSDRPRGALASNRCYDNRIEFSLAK